MTASLVPPVRITNLHSRDINRAGHYVLYWMIAQRRLGSNFALQRAADWARELHLPLVVLEPLNCDYRWACDRHHAFIIQGMQDHAQAAQHLPLTYLPYIEPSPRAGDGLLATLAAEAAVVVTDDYPCFFHPALLRVAARRTPCRFEAVDSNGLFPMRAAPKAFARAFDFRRFLQRELPPHLPELPEIAPFEGLSASRWEPRPSLLNRWPLADLQRPLAEILAPLPINHQVAPSRELGGSRAAQQRLDEFIAQYLRRYGEERSEPSLDVASRLSAYLHYGHLSAHEILRKVAAQESWNPSQVAATCSGSSEGWWRTSPSAESFLDELVTWRELGFNFCSQRRDYARYESLPDWAQATLEEHSRDPRVPCYDEDTLDQARTHDEVWNAAQRQLVREGRIHNYLRMLWGKKILEWSSSPREALRIMIELNNRYAIDGRDPNSYSGIFWVLGRYDRAWGPERPIFGMIRYMSSDNTRRKFDLKPYLARYSTQAAAPRLFE